MNEVWKKLLKHLPLCAAEGSGVTEVAAGELERFIEEDSDCPRAMVALVQEIFCRAGLLEPVRAREGVWRFVSYPARLFACSLLSLLVEGQGPFWEGFWAAGMNDDISRQHKVLHAMEVLREERTKGPPIRRTFVAWGVIRREGRFILKRRENREDDPDNALHGNYGFPGGRVNLHDLKESEPGMTTERGIELLYGLPRPLSADEEALIGRALEHTLVRELQEELGLQHKVHYAYSRSDFQRPPATFIHGANAQHCMTECRFTLFEIALTLAGDAWLASNVKDGELFRLDEMQAPCLPERRAFLDAQDDGFPEWLEELGDSASSLFLRRAELSPGGGGQKGEEPLEVVLPLSAQGHQRPLIVGDCEILLTDPWEIDFLFLLGLSARGETSLRLPDDIERRHWGWLFLRNTDMRLRAQKLELRVREIGNFSPLRLEGSLCRLRAEGGNVFFSPDLFSAELRQGELFLRRGALDRPGLFYLDAETHAAAFSDSNLAHLRNLKGGGSGEVSYDNLRKLKDKSGRRLDDFVRSCGLQRLYEPEDGSVSKELQRFRFAIQVR